ncbi:MAG TPA: signal recognition particle-docking protein FtsY [Clostridiales bacterium]|jgi:fused signal recognition particle receptor|nr:signal recognition particle-docking protein FtsY [Clostridiales bacterium]
MLADKKRGSFFGRMQERIEEVLLLRPRPDEDMLEELEEILITSDIGLETAEKIIDGLRRAIRENRLTDVSSIKREIRDSTASLLDKGERHLMDERDPLVVLVVGVNGSGKTTTIAKLAGLYADQGKSVLLVAADTFRAAAAEQLSVWGERLSIPVIAHREGADPSAVVYDGISAAKARGTNVVICDTAGRLQTKKNLMAELAKMSRVIEREYPEAGRETLLVLDATTGKNAVSQTREFNEATEITGIVLTKMDGTAKGGIVVTLADEFDLPVKFIGTGEGIGDLDAFDPAAFADHVFMEYNNG